MAGWFGKRKRQRQQERNAALEAIMGAAQDRGVPTMRVDDPDELAISLGLAQQQQGNLALAEETFRLIAGDGRRAAPKAAFYLGVIQQDRGDRPAPSGPSGRPRPPVISRSRPARP